MTNQIAVEWKYVRTYGTEANLMKELKKRGYDDPDMPRYIVTRTPEGRWTAIFLVTEWLRKNGGMSPIQDFLVI